jgi:hypothetical protein
VIRGKVSSKVGMVFGNPKFPPVKRKQLLVIPE